MKCNSWWDCQAFTGIAFIHSIGTKIHLDYLEKSNVILIVEDHSLSVHISISIVMGS